MERHERYDPEDIEHLLSERSFDELLPEERAFVLRHVSGREEYETMRSLLRHVRKGEPERMEITADERVRGAVLEAFRAQQQPQWRIWLNSVAALFQVREAYGFWRPAMAFGGLAVLVGLGVWFATTMGPGAHDQVAEVKQVTKEVERVPAAPEAAEVEVSPGLSDQQATPASEDLREEGNARLSTGAPAVEPAMVTDNARSDVYESEVADIDLDERKVVVREKEEVAAAEDVVSEQLEEESIRTVSMEELSRNQSAVNASGVAEKASASKAKRRTTLPNGVRTADADPEVWAFLTNGW
jgi:hypothetical protein